MRVIGEGGMHVITHVGVGFDGEDAVGVFEEDFGEHAGAGADVGDEPRGREAAPGAEVGEDLGGGIALAIAVVVFGAAGEAVCVVGLCLVRLGLIRHVDEMLRGVERSLIRE